MPIGCLSASGCSPFSRPSILSSSIAVTLRIERHVDHSLSRPAELKGTGVTGPLAQGPAEILDLQDVVVHPRPALGGARRRRLAGMVVAVDLELRLTEDRRVPRRGEPDEAGGAVKGDLLARVHAHRGDRGEAERREVAGDMGEDVDPVLADDVGGEAPRLLAGNEPGRAEGVDADVGQAAAAGLGAVAAVLR